MLYSKMRKRWRWCRPDGIGVCTHQTDQNGQRRQVALILRNREFDRYALDFLTRYPNAVVVHIGCGLDARFERVDNGQVEWYDLDFPPVIEFRRKFISDEGGRYHFLACSALDKRLANDRERSSSASISLSHRGRLDVLEESQVKSLVLTLRDHFPGAELVFDAFSPFLIRGNNLQLGISSAKIGARYKFRGIKHGDQPRGVGRRHSSAGGMVSFRPPRAAPRTHSMGAPYSGIGKGNGHFPLPISR